MYNWFYTALFFITFSFAGWLMETILVSVTTKKFVNRGFMVGSFCPIYGVGVSAMYVMLSPFSDNVILLFIMGLIVTTALEYVTSWLMEIIFNARWWDYSSHKYNLNGRVSLSISIYWGILSVLIIKYILPLLTTAITHVFNKILAEIFITAFGIYFAIDFSFSAYNAFGLNKILKELSNIRKEIAKNIENSKIFEVVDGMKIKTDELSKKLENITTDLIKDRLTENMTTGIENVYFRLKELRDSYNNKIKASNFFKIRLLKAFPDLKAAKSKTNNTTAYDKAIIDLKESKSK